MAGKADKKINNWKKVRLLATVFTVGFILNAIWENAQVPLYQGYPGFWDHFMICIVDAIAILFLFGLVSVWKNNIDWIRKLTLKDIVVLVLAGGAIAVVFEHWAFEYGMWTYTDKMPVVPVLNIGLSPLLQMMLLPATTVYIAGKYVSNKNSNKINDRPGDI